MLDVNNDPPEFTDEQLRAACQSVGEEARRAAFAVGRPVMILRNGRRILLFADGSEQDAGSAVMPSAINSGHTP